MNETNDFDELYPRYDVAAFDAHMEGDDAYGFPSDVFDSMYDDEIEGYNVPELQDLAMNVIETCVNDTNEHRLRIAAGCAYLATAQIIANEFIERNGSSMNSWTLDEYNEIMAMGKIMQPLRQMCIGVGEWNVLDSNPISDLEREASLWRSTAFPGKTYRNITELVRMWDAELNEEEESGS